MIARRTITFAITILYALSDIGFASLSVASAANNSAGDSEPRGRIEFSGQHGGERKRTKQRSAEGDDNSHDMIEQSEEAEAQHQAPLVSDGVASEQATVRSRRNFTCFRFIRMISAS
jgi:hypothetical protein